MIRQLMGEQIMDRAAENEPTVDVKICPLIREQIMDRTAENDPTVDKRRGSEKKLHHMSERIETGLYSTHLRPAESIRVADMSRHSA